MMTFSCFNPLFKLFSSDSTSFFFLNDNPTFLVTSDKTFVLALVFCSIYALLLLQFSFISFLLFLMCSFGLYTFKNTMELFSSRSLHSYNSCFYMLRFSFLLTLRFYLSFSCSIVLFCISVFKCSLELSTMLLLWISFFYCLFLFT